MNPRIADVKGDLHLNTLAASQVAPYFLRSALVLTRAHRYLLGSLASVRSLVSWYCSKRSSKVDCCFSTIVSRATSAAGCVGDNSVTKATN